MCSAVVHYVRSLVPTINSTNTTSVLISYHQHSQLAAHDSQSSSIPSPLPLASTSVHHLNTSSSFSSFLYQQYNLFDNLFQLVVSNSSSSCRQSASFSKIEPSQNQAQAAEGRFNRRRIAQQILRTVSLLSTPKLSSSYSLSLSSSFNPPSPHMRGGVVDSRVQHFENMIDSQSSITYRDSDSSTSLPSNLSAIPTIVPLPKQSVTPYRICIATYDQKHADTICPVYIQLRGDIGFTDNILLRHQSGKVYTSFSSSSSDIDTQHDHSFPKGSVREFGFEARDVGNITSIALRHDSYQDPYATWRPERITVSNETLYRTWSFLCPQWLNAQCGQVIELKPSGDISAGRRASRRASRRISGKLPIANINSTPTENFQSIRAKFSEKTATLSRTESLSNGCEVGTRRVLFSLQKYTQTSSHMYLLGGIPALGEWQPANAIRMMMHSGLDGTWRGEWRLELEIDDDYDIIEYTYMIVSENENPEKRTVKFPDVRRQFSLNSDHSGTPRAEGGRVTIKDIFGGSNKFGKQYSLKPQYGSTRPLPHHESVRTPLGKATLIAGCLGPNHTPTMFTSGKFDSVQRNLHSALESSQEDIGSTSSFDQGAQVAATQDVPTSHDRNSLPSSSVPGAPKDNRDFDHATGHLHEQIQVTAGQIERTEERFLHKKSEVISIRKRSSLELGNDPVLLPPSRASPDRTSPISSDGIPDDDVPSDEPEENLSDILHEDESDISEKDDNAITAASLRALEERDERTAEVAITLLRRCNLLTQELEEMKSLQAEQQEDLATKHADLVGLMMDEKEASANERQQILTERDLYAGRWAREFKERRKLFNTIQELRGNIRVFCRVRPLKSRSSSGGTSAKLAMEFPDTAIDEHSRIRLGTKDFEFDHIFDPSASQKQVYDETSGVVASVLDGYNVCVFAYGQTGSGKTHTMNGPSDDRGVNFRALVDLFDIANERSEHSSVEICVSMLEIYNETLRDLIRPIEQDNPPKLDIRKDPNSSSSTAVHVPNLTEERVKCVQDVWDLMEQGSANRSKGKTDMNAHSSRSHLILKVKVSCEVLSSGVKSCGVLHLVDLAGSERIARSNATGDRLTEAQHINKSLATLGDVFTALLSNSPHIPYRNSRLTYLLQDCLGGDSKTLMFVNISADEGDSSESLSSLQFAQRVAKIELGSAQRHTERTAETKAAAALQAKEGELKDVHGRFASIQRELKKKDECVTEYKQRIRSLENELKNSKRSMEEQIKRESNGSAKELRDLRVLNERGQRDLKAATQKAKDILSSKDDEITKLKALLKTKDRAISELNTKLTRAERETSGITSMKRIQRPSIGPAATPNTDRAQLSRTHRSAATFTGRSRQVRFEDAIPQGELPPPSEDDEEPLPPPTPSMTARRATLLPRSATVHGTRIQRTPSRNIPNSSTTAKRTNYGYGSRVESTTSENNAAPRPLRNTRFTRSHSTMRPAQRAQLSTGGRPTTGILGAGRTAGPNLRRAASTTSVIRSNPESDPSSS